MPRIVPEPQIFHTFERTRRLPDPQPLELLPVIIAPHKQVFDPFDSAGTPIDTGLLGSYDWPSQSKNVSVPRGWGSETTQYDVPGILPGALLEELDLWAVQGSGVSQTIKKLRSEEDENVLAAQTAAVATLTPDASLDGRTFTLSDSTVSFKRLFDQNPDVVFPSNDAEYAEGDWALVRIGEGIGGPFLVSQAPTESNPYQITLRSLGYVPVKEVQTVSYELLLSAREFNLVQGPVPARMELACRSALQNDFYHLKLTQPGEVTVSTGGGHASALILTVDAPGAMTDDQTFTLTQTGGGSRIYAIDTAGDGGPGGEDVTIDISGAANAAAAALLVATSIAGDGNFDAFVHPLNDDQIVVRQLTVGVAGNQVVTATAGFDIFQNAVDDPANEGSALFAIFDGGSASAGTSYTFRNVSDKPVRMKFATATGVVNGAHPGWETNGDDEYQTVGNVGFVLPAGDTASPYQINALLSLESQGGPRIYVEPASVDTWTDTDNVAGRPTRTLTQLLAAPSTDLSGLDFTSGDEPVGEILVPAATVRRIQLTHGLMDAFFKEDTLTISAQSVDRGAVAASTGVKTCVIDIPTDAGTVPIGRAVDSSAPPLHETVLEAVNAAAVTYYAGLGYDHVPEDLLRLTAHPDDQAFLSNDATQWHALPILAGLGIDGGSAASLPQFFNDVAGSQEAVNMLCTPQTPAGMVTLEYRTEGSFGNGLNIGFLYKINSGVAQTLAISNANSELLITMPTDVKGRPQDVTLDELAVLLDEQDVAGNYTYPIKVSQVLSAATGAVVDPVDAAYSGWDELPLEGFSLREIHSYTDSNSDSKSARINRSDRADLYDGSDAAAVARLDDTLRGFGSLGSTPLYAEYVALRTDSSPRASLSVHGRTPDLVRVRQADIETVVGTPNAKDPMSVAVAQYFSTSNNATVYIVGVDEISEENPWGTQDAYDRVWDLLLRRSGYHHFFFNDADWVRTWITSKLTSLGGEVQEDGSVSFLSNAMYAYTPEKIPETAPDTKISEGSDIELVSDNDTVSVLNTGTNLSTDAVAAGDILVSLGATGAGSVELQDGRTGWPILSVDVASPTRFTVNATSLPEIIFSSPGDPEPWEIVRPGQALRDNLGVYRSEEAKDALVALHSTEGTYHRRLQKHVANSYTDVFDGRRISLDGVYLLAQYAGIVARTKDQIPSSQARYSDTVESLESIRTFFNDSQVEQVVGVGLTCAQQKITPSGRVIVYRDVTSVIGSTDTSVATKTAQRRGSQVVEDLLVRRVDRRVRPRMAQALLTIQFLDSVAADVDSIMQYFRDAGLLKEITLQSITFIDDEIREAYGLDDTGLLIVWSYTHMDEAGVLIFRHVVNNQ